MGSSRTWTAFLSLSGWVGLCAALTLLNACAAEEAPDLLDVRAVGPSALELGTVLEVRGSGFPESARGRLTLEGTVFAPAERPREVRVGLEARAESRARIAVRVDARQLGALAQGAGHVTFRGHVDVEFAPARAGGPVLRGRSPELVLDVFQHGATPSDASAFAEFLGVRLGEGLEIEALEPDGEAARAGLAVGDRLLDLDGLRLAARDDFSPAAGADVSALAFERPGVEGVATALVDRAGFQPTSSAAAVEALLLACVLLVALLGAARPPRVLVWAIGRVGRRASSASPSPPGQAVSFGVVAGLLWLVVADAGRAARASGWFDLELTLLFGASCALLSAFWLGGVSGKRRFSFAGAVLSALGAALWLLPVFAAAVLRASETGSLQLAELARLQGPSLFGWALLDSPAALALALAHWGALLPRGGFRPALELLPGASAARTSRGAEMLGTFGRTWLAGVWVIVFAGGAEGFGAGSSLGGIWFAGKLWLVLAALNATSRWLAEPRVTESWTLLGRVVFSCVILGLAFFLLSWRGAPELAHVELSRRGVLVGLSGAALLSGVSISRALAHSGRRADPWI